MANFPVYSIGGSLIFLLSGTFHHRFTSLICTVAKVSQYIILHFEFTNESIHHWRNRYKLGVGDWPEIGVRFDGGYRAVYNPSLVNTQDTMGLQQGIQSVQHRGTETGNQHIIKMYETCSTLNILVRLGSMSAYTDFYKKWEYSSIILDRISEFSKYKFQCCTKY